MDDEPKTLLEIARGRWRHRQLPVGDDEVTRALTASDIDPKDEKERERLRRLTMAQAEFLTCEEKARFGRHTDRAETELPNDTDDDEIVGLAGQYARQQQDWEEEQREE